MSIHFAAEQFEKVKNNHIKWWDGKLGRPLIKCTVNDAYPITNVNDTPLITQANCLDFSIPAEDIVNRLDAELSRQMYLGDAYPCVNFDVFGPSMLAGLLGANMDNSSGLMWFSVKNPLDIEDIHVKYDKNNPLSKRIKSIYRAGNALWKNNVIMSIPDLGSPLDVAAVLCGDENLLMSLIDDPDEVDRLSLEIEEAWNEAYDDFYSVIAAEQQGITDWNGIYSDKPSYVLQCDFAYMVSSEMFNRHIFPYLERACKKYDNTIFHMDGVGELKHLDKILSIEDLNAIQWQYGEGQPSAIHWDDVYSKIAKTGRGIHVIGDHKDFDHVYEKHSHNLYYNETISIDLLNDEKEFLKKYDIIQ